MPRNGAIWLTWPGRSAGSDERAPVPRLVPVGQTGAGIELIHGDNAGALASLVDRMSSQVTLAYLDPPFFTMREFEQVSRKRTPGGPPIRILTAAFDDRWADLQSYLVTLKQRLEGIRPLLAPHGSVVVHVDPRTSHYVKVIGDEVFGPEAFASEIVWRYRRWPARTPNFQRVHDVLLRWIADAESRPRFNQLYEELAESTLKTWGRGRQRAVFDTSGRRRRSSTEPSTSPGAPMGDVWELSIIAPVSHERTGYPTQKPEALMERLLLSCTGPGELVLDPYMGSGTTLAVAARLGRRAVGIDSSHVAIAVARERLRSAAVEFSEFRVVHSRASAAETPSDSQAS